MLHPKAPGTAPCLHPGDPPGASAFSGSRHLAPASTTGLLLLGGGWRQGSVSHPPASALESQPRRKSFYRTLMQSSQQQDTRDKRRG